MERHRWPHDLRTNVVLYAFPTGHFTYNSAGTIQRTVRRFSGSLPTAVKLNLKAKQYAGIGSTVPPTAPPKQNSFSRQLQPNIYTVKSVLKSCWYLKGSVTNEQNEK
jgi:hypothetical protein